MAKRSDNSRIAAGIVTSEPTAASWDVFDRLPARLRRAMWQAPIAINPQSAAEVLEYGGLIEALEGIETACDAEILAFNRQHERKHGYPLPHVAARATIQPYAPPPRRRR